MQTIQLSTYSRCCRQRDLGGKCASVRMGEDTGLDITSIKVIRQLKGKSPERDSHSAVVR